MADVADRILAAIKTHLAAVSGVAGAYLQPLHLLTASQLPALIIDDVKDEFMPNGGEVTDGSVAGDMSEARL